LAKAEAVPAAKAIMSILIEPGQAATLVPADQQAWLQPLGDSPCGDDLDYDNQFLALQQAATGKAETQFAPAEPADWRAVASFCTELFDRTRDLRVALLWLRAQVNLQGLPGLPQGLALVIALLEDHWEALHPKPDADDDNDPYARLSALGVLSEFEGLVGELRNARIFANRSVGELSFRDVEIALGKLSPRDGENGMSRGQVSQMLEAALGVDAHLREQLEQSQALLKRLHALLRDQVGIERATDIRPLHELLQGVLQCMPETAAAGGSAEAAGSEADTDGGGAAETPSGVVPKKAGLPNALHTREDALRAIELVCDYLERTEPTNPAQLLLRRARKLINKNFLQLMRELAPDAMNEVARIMGVDPDSIDNGES
jgi:type VI secretion system protein ImpA